MRTLCITLVCFPLAQIIVDRFFHHDYLYGAAAIVSLVGFLGYVYFTNKDFLDLFKDEN